MMSLYVGTKINNQNTLPTYKKHAYKFLPPFAKKEDLYTEQLVFTFIHGPQTLNVVFTGV